MFNIPYVVENKAYSRDWLVRGRMRVNLGVVTNEAVNTSMPIDSLPLSMSFNRNEADV